MFIRRKVTETIPTTARICLAPECDTTIHRTKIACPRDWWRLPSEIRTTITNATPRTGGGLRAVLDAQAWFQANPNPGPAGGAT